MLVLRAAAVLLCLSVSVHGWSKAITKAEKDDGGFNFRNNGYVTRCLPLVGSLVGRGAGPSHAPAATNPPRHHPPPHGMLRGAFPWSVPCSGCEPVPCGEAPNPSHPPAATHPLDTTLLPTRKWPWPGVTAATKYGPAEIPFGTQASPDAPLPTTSHKNGENKARETAHSGQRKGSSGLRHNLDTMTTLR